ncbi:MAG: DoxX family protein [Deltaproteobacteria bacterium]|jgi:hypothetical protein|nr:DoxX family protein [Deltaproteobacteria bacterium]
MTTEPRPTNPTNLTTLGQRGRAFLGLIWPYAARILLGSAFIFASVLKIGAPTEMASTIAGYRLLPDVLTPIFAHFLPSLEFWVGLSILIGSFHFRRAGALLCALMLVVFMLAAAQGLVRGLDFDCGCFGFESGRPDFFFFVRDLVLLLAAISVYRSGGGRKTST